jgi:hypothetical protein
MLLPHITHPFKSPVWRLEIDALSKTIFIEVRDQSDKKVTFASIHLDTGQFFFDELQTEERWLTGIEAAYEGILLLHNYQSEATPAHKGLTAIDGLTGQIVWSNYTHAFDHLTIKGPAIYDTRLQSRKLWIADIRTGAVSRPYEPSIDLELNNEVALPAEISPEILRSMPLELSPFGNAVHYLEHNNYRIVSLHTFAEGVLQQHLYIMDSNGIVYHDLLNTCIQKLQPESFLMHRDYLIYLKDKSQLKVLNLYLLF